LALLRNGRVEADSFTDASNDDAIPPSGAIIVSLAQWQDHRDALIAREEPLGIVLHSDEKPESIADDIERFAVIALDFPAFRDGRAYSYARLLRDRYNYEGELRAVGDVLLEQLHFMHRVGFNSFHIKSDDAASAWEVAAADITVWYQPTSDGRNSVIQLRHRRPSE
jgi:uncharacterized protein (DUF934 family)